MKATLCERIIIGAVTGGEWEIDPDGRIWRISIRGGDRWNPGTYRLNKCNRRRVERKEKTTGYLTVRLVSDGKRHLCGAHRLVWQHFNGDIPDGLVINHINGLKDDNRPSNLEVLTYSDNTKHAYRVGLMDEHGERNPANTISDHNVGVIRAAYAAGGVTMFELGRRFNCAFQTVSDIIRGDSRSKQAGPVDRRDHRHNSCAKDPVTGRFLPRPISMVQFPGDVR